MEPKSGLNRLKNLLFTYDEKIQINDQNKLKLHFKVRYENCKNNRYTTLAIKSWPHKANTQTKTTLDSLPVVGHH